MSPVTRRSTSQLRLVAFAMFMGAAIASILLPCHAAAQNVITLRSQTSVVNAGPITLGDIAAISGPDATTLLPVVIAPAGPASGEKVTIQLEEVRNTLLGIKTINMGRVRLTGIACQVSGEGATARDDSGAATPPPLALSGASLLAGADTVRARITRRVGELLEASPDDLRLTFDAQPTELLDRVVGRYTCAVQPSGSGDRLPFTVKLYEGDRLFAAGSVRVGVLIRRSVLVASQPLTRGDAITEDVTTQDEQWLPPSIVPLHADGADGQVVKTRVAAGEVLQQRHVESPIVIKKGDIVGVDCIAGGVVVRANARAVESGRDGQIITLHSLISKSTLKARVSGPGTAIIVAQGTQATPPAFAANAK